jgi:hypothetical protein
MLRRPGEIGAKQISVLSDHPAIEQAGSLL